MYCRVCVDERDVGRRYVEDVFVCDVCRRQTVLGWRSPTLCLHLHDGLLLGFRYRHDVRGHGRVLHGLSGWQIVRGQRGPACCLHVLPRLRLDERDIGRVHDDKRDLHIMCCGQVVRGKRGSAY